MNKVGLHVFIIKQLKVVGFRAIKEIIYAGFMHSIYGFSGTLQYELPDPN